MKYVCGAPGKEFTIPDFDCPDHCYSSFIPENELEIDQSLGKVSIKDSNKEVKQFESFIVHDRLIGSSTNNRPIILKQN